MLLNSSPLLFCSHKKTHVVTCQFKSKSVPPRPASRRPEPSEFVVSFDNRTQEHVSLVQKNNLILSNVRKMLGQTDEHSESITVVDVLQRVGMDRHFSDEIDNTLKSLYEIFHVGHMTSCCEAALAFRLLRQAGYYVPSDIFYSFLDAKGEFLPDLKKDTKGLINLYEASHLNIGGEGILYKAKEFASKHLVSSMARLDPNHAIFVRQTLDLPCHTSLPRYKTRQYLDQEHDEIGWQRDIKQLARSEFMQLQSLHQDELVAVTSWWKKSGLPQVLWFARDQPLKWYFCTLAVIPDAKFSKHRVMLSKVISFIYLIDDIYDVHSSNDELYLFTKAISKWDLSAIDSLPNYMRFCYTALHKITNEVAEMVMKEHGWNPISVFIKSWVDLCNAFWVENKWFISKHIPTSDGYLRNGIITCGTHIVYVHLFFLMGEGISKESIVQLSETYRKLATSPATILRLSDDLGSAKDENQEGLDGSYLACYKKENPHSTNECARAEIERKIMQEWEELNKDYILSSNSCSNKFRTACLNAARMVEVLYTYDEDHKLPMLQDFVNSLLFRNVI